MPVKRLPEFIRRLSALEDKMTQHLTESEGIKTNLTWNTRLTILILTAVIGKLCVEFLKK